MYSYSFAPPAQEQKKTPNGEKAIKILAIVALIAQVIASLSRFIYSDTYLFFYFNINFATLLGSLIALTPFVLFVIYIFKYYQKSKATVLLCVIWGILGFQSLCSLLVGNGTPGLSLVAQVIFICGCGFSLYSSLKGISDKKFFLAGPIAGLTANVITLPSRFSTISHFLQLDMPFMALFSFAGFAASTALYVSLLLFGLKGTVPGVADATNSTMQHSSYIPAPSNTSTQSDLDALKASYDLGFITESEYQAQRDQILNKK